MRTTVRLAVVASLLLAVALVVALKRDGTTRGPVAASPRGDLALPRLVDVGADQCVPCKAMAPILDELREQYRGRLRVEFIDAWKYPERAEPFKVYGIPTQIFFDPAGRELYRHLGFFSKADILATWRRLGYPIDGAKS
jgi:thioredoxin 1